MGKSSKDSKAFHTRLPSFYTPRPNINHPSETPTNRMGVKNSSRVAGRRVHRQSVFRVIESVNVFGPRTQRFDDPWNRDPAVKSRVCLEQRFMRSGRGPPPHFSRQEGDRPGVGAGFELVSGLTEVEPSDSRITSRVLEHEGKNMNSIWS